MMLRFWIAAPDAPLPRLSSRAIRRALIAIGTAIEHGEFHPVPRQGVAPQQDLSRQAGRLADRHDLRLPRSGLQVRSRTSALNCARSAAWRGSGTSTTMAAMGGNNGRRENRSMGKPGIGPHFGQVLVPQRQAIGAKGDGGIGPPNRSIQRIAPTRIARLPR